MPLHWPVSGKRRSSKRHECRAPFRQALASLVLLALAVPAFAQMEQDDPVERVIHYYAPAGFADPVTRLQQRLNCGQVGLKFERKGGYLRSLLKELRVPVSSQGLVFSKTSSQADHTSPRTPRAVYFNNEVYVAWVPEGRLIDLTAVDPQRGPIFYTLEQKPGGPPKFIRRDECLRCHLGPKTVNVPGLLVRSAWTAGDGRALAEVEDFVSGHNSPLEARWGGWYVSGTHDGARHLGNTFATNAARPERTDFPAGGNVTDLRRRFDSARYLSRHSDIVALMVLEHQVRMQNLLTRANHETRYALDAAANAGSDPAWPRQRIGLAGELLLEYMLFRNEAALKGPVKGTSGFAANFQRGGPRTKDGRSLRQLDLQTRLFRYPCSFLIYSESFDALPAEMKTYLWRRLGEILRGEDPKPAYATMSAADRQALREILLATKPEFAAAETSGGRASTSVGGARSSVQD